MNQKALYKFSPSSLNLLEECPRCFWMQIVKKVSRPDGPFPSLPAGIDRLLKVHFDRFRDNNELPPELKKHNIDAELFHDKELLSVWRNNLKGIEYLNKRHNILLRGAVDNILQKNGKLIVLDYKTRGFALKKDTAHHYQNQLDIYNFLLRKNGYKTENYAYLLFFIPENILETGEFIFQTELVKMKINVNHAKKLFYKAIKIVKGEMPDSKDSCSFCKWRGLH